MIGFDPDTYYENLSQVTLSEERLHKLDSLQSEELVAIAKIVKQHKRASYEELKIEKICTII